MHSEEENVPEMQIKMQQGTDVKKKEEKKKCLFKQKWFHGFNLFIPSAVKKRDFKLTKAQMYFF